MIEAPPLRRVLVGAALRRYRENLGLLLEDAAQLLECDRSKISRIETGQRGIRPKELRELLTEYGAGEDEQRVLAGIVLAGRGGRWQQYGPALPGPYREYLALEQAASDILVYDPQQVPDLLQTPPYTQARLASAADAGLGAEVVLCRQQALAERGATVTAVVGEAAVREETGDLAVMRGQLRALGDACGRGIVQVLLSGCGVPSSGPVTILRFAGMPGLGVVYLPGLSGGVCLAGQQDVTSYARAFGQLRAAALTPAASARLVGELAGA